MVQKQISNIYLYLAKKIKYNLATFLLNVKGKNVDKTHIHYQREATKVKIQEKKTSNLP